MNDTFGYAKSRTQNVSNAPLRIYSQNVSGAASKIVAINHRLATSTYDLIFLQETWFIESMDDSPLIANVPFQIYRCDRSNFKSGLTRGGGVAILFGNSIDARIIELPATSIEIQCMKVSNTYFLNVYIPPHARLRIKYVNEFHRIVKLILEKYHSPNLCAIGDFNSPSIQWVNDEENPPFLIPIFAETKHERLFLEKISNLGFFQVLNLPNSRGMMLDLVFVNMINEVTVSHVSQTELLDQNTQHHSAISITLCVSTAETDDRDTGRIQSIKYRKSVADVEVWAKGIIDESFSHNPESLSFSGLKRILESHTSYVKYNVNKLQSKHPWTNNDSYRRLYTETRDFRRKMKLNDLDDKREYERLAAALRNKYDLLKSKFYTDVVKSGFNQSSQFFKFANSIRKPNANIPAVMHIDERYFTGQHRFQALADNLFSNFVRANDKKLNDSDLLNIYSRDFDDQYLHVWCDSEIVFDTIEVTNAINELNVSKGDGPMSIAVRFVKFHAHRIAPAIAKIFNHVFSTGIYPDDWKIAYLTPIPKRGKLDDIKNYRGVAISSVLPKLYDKLLTARIYSFLVEFVPTDQHGFVKSKGTTTNLFETSQFISDELAKGKQVDAVYFDFSKAFDRISHSILASKLAQVSTPYKLYRAIMGFVVQRNYVFRSSDCQAQYSATATCGVPQGSHIGPLLFIFYVHDILYSLNHPSLFSRLLADDTKFLCVIESFDDSKLMQSAIDSLVKWSTNNGLDLNAKKTKFVSFRRSKKLKFDTRYYIGTMPIVRSTHQMDLGIIFDEHMNFKMHLEYTRNKCNRILGVARKIVNDIKCSSLLLVLYRTYILPVIETNGIIWRVTSSHFTETIEEIQRRVTRTILRSAKRPGMPGYIAYEQRLHRLSLLKLSDRRKIAACGFFYRVMKNDISLITKNKLNNSIYDTTGSMRNRSYLKFPDRYASRDSPLHLLMLDVNELIAIMNLDETIESNKQWLKEYFLN